MKNYSIKDFKEIVKIMKERNIDLKKAKEIFDAIKLKVVINIKNK